MNPLTPIVGVLFGATLGLSAFGGITYMERNNLADRLAEAETHVRYHMGRAAKMEETHEEEMRSASDKCEVALFQQQQAINGQKR